MIVPVAEVGLCVLRPFMFANSNTPRNVHTIYCIYGFSKSDGVTVEYIH